MSRPPIADQDELWATVAAVRDGLLKVGAREHAKRLEDAMTLSGHPGEVWPATDRVLRDFLREQPPGLDAEAAHAAAEVLASWS